MRLKKRRQNIEWSSMMKSFGLFLESIEMWFSQQDEIAHRRRRSRQTTMTSMRTEKETKRNDSSESFSWVMKHIKHVERSFSEVVVANEDQRKERTSRRKPVNDAQVLPHCEDLRVAPSTTRERREKQGRDEINRLESFCCSLVRRVFSLLKCDFLWEVYLQLIFSGWLERCIFSSINIEQNGARALIEQDKWRRWWSSLAIGRCVIWPSNARKERCI